MREYFVYILSSQRNGTLYIGMTNDLIRRISEHKQGINEGFTKQYGINKLVFFEQYDCVPDAIEREKQMKKWKRSWKLQLIEKNNPNWKDLYEDLLD